MLQVSLTLYLDEIFDSELTLEGVKTFGVLGIGRKHFACEKDMNLGRGQKGEVLWAELCPSQYMYCSPNPQYLRM